MKPSTPESETGLSDTLDPPAKSPAPTKKISIASLLPGKGGVTCRHCGSTDVRPSHKATADSQHVVYRCRACKHHFKAVSARPRIHAAISVVLFLLVVVGVAASFFMSATPEVIYQPRVDMQDSQALAKKQAAAGKGDIQAQYDLGWAYWQHGDYANALPWIKAAASRGHVEAQYQLGLAYLNGQGTVQNYRAALEQFTQAADQGHLEAQYQLGIFYRDGLATLRNRETAYVWLNIAAARGHIDALALRDRLTMVMSGEEISRAQETSAQLHKRLGGTEPAKP